MMEKGTCNTNLFADILFGGPNSDEDKNKINDAAEYIFNRINELCTSNDNHYKGKLKAKVLSTNKEVRKELFGEETVYTVEIQDLVNTRKITITRNSIGITFECDLSKVPVWQKNLLKDAIAEQMLFTNKSILEEEETFKQNVDNIINRTIFMDILLFTVLHEMKGFYDKVASLDITM